MDADGMDAVLDVHLRGAFFMCRAAWSALRDSGAGRIVNTTSMAALVGNFGQVNYSAAKGGLFGMTKTLAIEGARAGIRCNAISPAAETNMTAGFWDDATRRHLSADMVSPLVVYLMSAECEVSGDVFAVGGGRVARIFLAQGPGFYSPTLDPDDIVANLDLIRSTDHWTEPVTVDDEFALMSSNWND
jgi:NAD(P)-dependent dehydrogenase (short-subunit alcohol dehydrogenase family)